ncbi:MAG: porin, partial [Sutterellaceae bacterium]|nr:porin [Sutterellaceae bacterium]
SDRYAALGASYINGPVQVAAVVDYLNKRSVGEGKFEGEENVQLNGYGDPDDAWTFNIGGAYDFEVAKVYGAVQYFKNAVDIGGIMSDDDEDTDDIFAHSYSSLDGFGVNIGADVPLAGGLFKVSAGYMDGEVNDILDAEDDGSDVEGYNIMAGYEYPFSKRTNVYVGAGYTKYKYEATDETGKYEIFQAMFGLVHKF